MFGISEKCGRIFIESLLEFFEESEVRGSLCLFCMFGNSCVNGISKKCVKLTESTSIESSIFIFIFIFSYILYSVSSLHISWILVSYHGSCIGVTLCCINVTLFCINMLPCFELVRGLYSGVLCYFVLQNIRVALNIGNSCPPIFLYSLKNCVNGGMNWTLITL